MGSFDDVAGSTGPGPGGTGTGAIRSYNFFLDTTIAGGGGYVDNKHSFVDPDGTTFTSHTIQLFNDSTHDMWFSFDGVTDHGRIKAGEKPTQDFRRVKIIWFRGTAGDAYRFWAW